MATERSSSMIAESYSASLTRKKAISASRNAPCPFIWRS